MSKLNLIKEIERLRINEDEYDDYESNKMSQEVAVAKMFTRLAKQGRDPIDMISHRFGWSTHELDDLAQQHGFKNTAEWMNSFERGVAEGKFTVNAKTGAKLHPRTGAELPPKEKPLTMKQMFAQPKLKAPKLTLDAVWRKVEDVVSRIYPDGDPIDYLAPWLERHGIRGFETGEILDRAAKKNGYKDLYDYYNSMKDLYGPEQGVAEGLNEAKTKTKTKPDILDYHVTASWKDRGTSHKRWDKDHMQGSPVDRHQSSIQLWQHEGKKPEYHAHHRIESGYWTDQTLEGPPTVVTHKSVHPSLDAAVDALEKHTNEFYKNKKAMKEHQGVAKGLNEAKTKTKTKPDISDTFKQKPDQPLTKKDDKKAEKPKDEPKGETPKFKVSSKDETLKKTAGIKMNDRAAELSSKMKDVEADPDDPGYPKHETLPSTNVKPDNAPAVINKAMTVKGFLNPEWHIVANLPGNMATAIRTVGRKLFKSFTRTPTDKIVMIGNVMNHGPNTNAEINAVAKWLKNAGQEVSSGDIDFSDFMPGYKADIKLYDAAGCRFLLVEDFAGRYVYVWPHNDSVTMSNSPQLTKEDINIIKEAELRFRTLAGL